MNKLKLTKLSVENLPFAGKGKQVDYYDSEQDGFGVRVSATGKKYFVRAHIGNRRIRVMMKGTKLISAEEARREALAKLGDMAQGVDPNQIEREKNRQTEERLLEEKQRAVPLQQVLDEYLQKTGGRKGKLKPRTIKTYQDVFRLYLADWLLRPASEITRDMVKSRHHEIATGKRLRQALKKNVSVDGAVVKVVDEKPREASADSCFRSLRAVLNYAFEDEEGIVPYSNPVNVLSSKKRKAWFKIERRRTLVKNSDLPAWSKAVEALENPIARDFLLLLIHTGLRRNEAAKLQWNNVDFAEACFTIPETKNGEPHTLPLSDYLLKLLMQRKAEAWHGNPYVFPGTGKDGYLQEPKRAIDTVTATTGITFTCHDLRRTFATIAESLDLSGYTVKALLNHKQQVGDVTGGYIIMNVDRLREPMQKITNAIQERIKKQHGQVIAMQAMAYK